MTDFDSTSSTGITIRTAIVGDIGIYREGLAEILDRQPTINVVGTRRSRAEALGCVGELRPDVLLIDMVMPDSIDLVRSLAGHEPEMRIVALSVRELEADVIACAEAGVAGYVTREASLGDVIDAVESAARGETICSPRMAASLLRRVGTLAAEREVAAKPPLTARELQVVGLIDEGLSNKQIASRLRIELPTVKNHVHNILEKLKVDRRAEAAAVVRGRTPRPASSATAEI